MHRIAAWSSLAQLVIGALLTSLLPAGCSDPTAPERPTIMSVSPASGPLTGGTAITITGSHFRNVTSVTIGGTPLGNLAIVSSTQLTGLTPAATAPGAVDVVVDADGGRRTCQGCFGYDLPMMPGARLGGGAAHTCQLDTTGAAYCWGSNYSGQLGDGTITPRTTPALVSGGLSFTSLATSGSHTCGVTGSGMAYCWGYNEYGQLGDGTTIDHVTPLTATGVT